MSKKSTGIDRQSQAVREGWRMTNEDMEAVAAERREEGWTVASMPAVHTSPVSKDQGDDPERFGLVHIIPDNDADEFVEAYERGEFPEYLAYRNEVENSAFLVTEFIDPDSRTIILVAGRYDLRHAGGMVRSAIDEGELYTHARTLDGTHLGSFRHEAFDALVPTPDDYDDESTRAGGDGG
jgi:hypothetical protein